MKPIFLLPNTSNSQDLPCVQQNAHVLSVVTDIPFLSQIFTSWFPPAHTDCRDQVFSPNSPNIDQNCMTAPTNPRRNTDSNSNFSWEDGEQQQQLGALLLALLGPADQQNNRQESRKSPLKGTTLFFLPT